MHRQPPSDLPIHAKDTDTPGRWVRKGGFETWEGARQWLTQDEDVVLLWDHGRPVHAWTVAGPGGRVGDAERISPYAWRFCSEDHVSLGTLSTDLKRIVAVEHHYSPPADGLEQALWQDRDMRALVRLRPFMKASAVYLHEHAFRPDRKDSGRETFTWEQATAMLSRMRGWGDAPLDMEAPSFAFKDHHAVMFEEVLERVRWHALTPEEFAIDHGRARRLLDEIDGRPIHSVARSERPVSLPLRALSVDGGGNSLSPRLLKAIEEGRCDRETVDLISKMIDYDDERLLADPEFVRGR